MIDREKIYAALFYRLGKLPGVATLSRRLLAWVDVTEFPAVFQAQKFEIGKKPGRGIPLVWTFEVELYVYVKVPANESPCTILNKLVDDINAALESDDPDGKQTLGGLVEDCWVEGQTATDEGTLGDLAITIIPVHILVNT